MTPHVFFCLFVFVLKVCILSYLQTRQWRIDPWTALCTSCSLYGTASDGDVIRSHPSFVAKTDSWFLCLVLKKPPRSWNDEGLRNIAVFPSGIPHKYIRAHTDIHKDAFLL